MDTVLLMLTDNFWIAAAIIASASTYLTSLVNNKLHPNKIWKQIISWVVSIILTVISFYAKLIPIGDSTWLTVLTTGVVVGLASNGIYDMRTMRTATGCWFNGILKKTNSKGWTEKQ